MALKKHIILTASLILSFAAVQRGAASSEAQKVVILANASDSNSIAIAEYYAEQRDIPTENIVALLMPTKETISIKEFVNTVHNPLLDALIEKRWMRVVKAKEKDGLGRTRALVGVHDISYLVTTRGVPLRIANDPKLIEAKFKELPVQFRVNNGSVDSELALLIGPENLSMTAYVPNPFFKDAEGKDLDKTRIIRTSRLDGPSVESIKRIIDLSLKAEREGLMGRAYFDLGGPHASGDEWIRAAADLAEKAYFDTDIETTQGLLNETNRYDAPAIYMGWYRQHAYGIWSQPRWAVSPGAIGFHLHSFSATTVRSTAEGWLGAFISQGYCATVGNVYEPYLQYTHHPHILLEALLEGHTFGEATMLSNPVLSWQGVAIGDPLYRPFKVSLDAQLEESVGNPLETYIYLREINRFEDRVGTGKALASAENRFKQQPTVPLAKKLAELYIVKGEPDEAVNALKVVSAVNAFAVDELMLAKEIADFLSEQGEHTLAVEIYRKLLGQTDLSKAQRIAVLVEGSKAALKKGDTLLSLEWKNTAETLK